MTSTASRLLALGILFTVACSTTPPDDARTSASRVDLGGTQTRFTGTCQLEYSGLYCHQAGCASHPVDSQVLPVQFEVTTDASGTMSVDGSIFTVSYPTATDQAWIQNASKCLAGSPEDVSFPQSGWTGDLRCSGYLEACTVASQGDCEGLSFQGQTQPDGGQTLSYSYVANATGGIGGYVTISCTAHSADACGDTCNATQVCNGGTCACAGGKTSCGAGENTYCVDTSSDVNNCGACARGCAWPQTCSAGACACPSGQAACGNGQACTDTSSDAANCGACGNACGENQTCQHGVCGCQPGSTACGAACVYPMFDSSNCGACGVVCSGGQTCHSGFCACGSSQLTCGDTCADPSSDPLNCGACGNACPAGTTCQSGACQ